jgi:hypothetical protein
VFDSEIVELFTRTTVAVDTSELEAARRLIAEEKRKSMDLERRLSEMERANELIIVC